MWSVLEPKVKQPTPNGPLATGGSICTALGLLGGGGGGTEGKPHVSRTALNRRFFAFSRVSQSFGLPPWQQEGQLLWDLACPSSLVQHKASALGFWGQAS